MNESGEEITNGTDFQMELPDFELERILVVVVPLLFGVIVVLGLVGNALVVLVVAFNSTMRSTTNLLIINLAVADLLFITFCVPFTAWDYAGYWPFGETWCRVVQYLVIVCAYASIYTLVLMSLDRFLAVVHPIRSMALRTTRNASIAIALTWFVIVVLCLPALPAHGLVHLYAGAIQCRFLTEEYSLAAFQISFFLSSYVIPLAAVFILYLLMLKRLWLGAGPSGHYSAESVRSKKRVTRLVVVVVFIFAACWCPIQLVLVLRSVNAYNTDTLPRIIILIASQILAYTNSCVNPFLYAFLSDNFRKAFRKACACGERTGRGVDLERTDTNLCSNTRQEGPRMQISSADTCATTKLTTTIPNDIL